MGNGAVDRAGSWGNLQNISGKMAASEKGMGDIAAIGEAHSVSWGTNEIGDPLARPARVLHDAMSAGSRSELLG